MVQEEWAFLNNFEQEYGTEHPFFYACKFMDALKIAKDEHKFLFVYFHSPQHPFTPSFCSETLCCDLVVQFLDANYVCWGALADRGEGLHMATSLRASSFPFCALVAPAPGDSIAVLQQVTLEFIIFNCSSFLIALSTNCIKILCIDKDTKGDITLKIVRVLSCELEVIGSSVETT